MPKVARDDAPREKKQTAETAKVTSTKKPASVAAAAAASSSSSKKRKRPSDDDVEEKEDDFGKADQKKAAEKEPPAHERPTDHLPYIENESIGSLMEKRITGILTIDDRRQPKEFLRRHLLTL